MTDEVAIPSRPAPYGLGGWLILVGFGLILSPVRQFIFFVQTFVPIFLDGSWDAITTPGSDAYHPLLGLLLIGEVTGNLVFVAFGVCLLILFFQRSRRFPKLYVIYLVATLAFTLGDALLATQVLQDESLSDPSTAYELWRSLVVVVLWVPYMRLSNRVDNTFVE